MIYNGRGFDIQPAEVDNELSCVRRKPSEIEDWFQIVIDFILLKNLSLFFLIEPL